MHTSTTKQETTTATGFNTFKLHSDLLRGVQEMGFDRPTPIQSDTIPHALEGRDLLACASTGSGKTAAFLLPILEKLRATPKGGTRALIITPTRELAAQIVDHAKALSKYTGVRAAAIYGGVGMRPQEDALRKGVDIIVATPGRLQDHMQYEYAKLDKIEILVLDEADRMLDMGFLPHVKRVLSMLPKRPRQTLFFSATMPPAIAQLSREMLKNPASVNIERKSAPATGITQALYPVDATRKTDLLLELLQRNEIGNAIVFCRTKHRANRVAEKLERAGISTTRMHGNRSQNQRTEALAGFKNGRYRVLVATDIVARGIDVEALDHVVNFDVPATAEDYIHRCGRTARAEATGDAYTFVAPEDESMVRDIERATQKKIERRKLEGFDYSRKSQEQLEVPLAQRLAAMRAQRAVGRSRVAAGASEQPREPRRQPHRKRRGRPKA